MPYTINHANVAKLLYGKTTYPDMIPIYHELRFRAGQVAATARVKAGKRTGRLAASIRVTDKITPPFLWFKVEANTPYAYMHHQGTKPHIIVGSLSFRSSGRMIHTREVHHPGTSPNPYLRTSLPLFMRVHETGRYVALDRAMAARYK